MSIRDIWTYLKYLLKIKWKIINQHYSTGDFKANHFYSQWLFFISRWWIKHLYCFLNFRRVKATDSLRVLINLFVALFLLNVAFLSNEYVARAKDITACRVMAGFMHYCLLSSFTWFAVEAFHLCLQMAKHSVTIKHYIIKISVVGWGEFRSPVLSVLRQSKMIKCAKIPRTLKALSY